MSSPSQVDSLMFNVTIAQCAIASLGFVMNSFLVWVILKNGKLRDTIGSLFILVLSVYYAISEFSVMGLPTVLVATGTTIPLLQCFFVQSYAPIVAMNYEQLMLTISCDRLFCVLMPIRYKMLSMGHRHSYVFGLVCGTFAVLSCPLVWFYRFSRDNQNKPVFCQPTDVISPSALTPLLWLTTAQNVGMMLIYVLIGLLFKLKVVQKQSSADRRLIKTLFVLIATSFFCWLPYPLLGSFLFPYLPIEASAKNVALRVLVQLNKVVQSANGPLLYFCSSEYRAAIQKEVRRLAVLLMGSAAAPPSTSSVQHSRRNGVRTTVETMRNNLVAPAN